jgi:hypothetical protein
MSENKKRIAVVASGASGDANTKTKYEVDIEPGTRVGDVLSQLGLRNYTMSNSRAVSLNEMENLFPMVADGEEIHASPSMVAGR